jgi:hypothetical protein
VREGGGAGRWPRHPVLAAAAAALVAVDAMPLADARALVAGYDPALARGRGVTAIRCAHRRPGALPRRGQISADSG